MAPLASRGEETAKAEYALAPKPAWVKSVKPDVNATIELDKQSDGIAYLLVDRQVRMLGSDKDLFTHNAVKILQESGLRQAANVEVTFDPTYQFLQIHDVVIHRGGLEISKSNNTPIRVARREQSMDSLIYNGSKTAHLFLEDVRVGDVIEYAYTLRGSNPVFGGRHFGEFGLQWSIPVHQMYARLLTDNDHKPVVSLYKTSQKTETRQVGNQWDFTWESSKVDALPYKDDVPGWYEPYPKVQWSNFKDWKAVAIWGAGLFELAEELPDELKVEVKRIKDNYPHPQDRLVEALRFVQKNIRYLGIEIGPSSHAPNQAADVLRRRYGDCKDKTLLTLTMLRALGIRANAALVHSRRKAGIENSQPNPGAFNHVIVRAELGDLVYWLDPTSDTQLGRLGDISQANFGKALVLSTDQTELQDIPIGPAMSYSVKSLAVFDVTGSKELPVPFTVTTVLTGHSAERMRSRAANTAPLELQRHMTNYYAKFYPGIAVKKPHTMRDNTATNQITIVEHYTIANFWTALPSGNKEAFVASPDVLDYLRAPSNAVRNEPLAIAHPVDVVQTTYVQMPREWNYKNGSTAVRTDTYDFVSSVNFEPGRLTLTDSYKSKKDAVEASNVRSYLSDLKRSRGLLGFTFNRSEKDD